MQEHRQARFIVETLAKRGFIAYYAGGWVRDFILQRESDDIDIATSAPPEVIQELFPHTVPIGIAFGIVLVIVEGHQYEVATFRQDFDYVDGRRPTTVKFSSAEEDAKRRDFTINGMFFDPLEEKIFDFVGGQQDLKARVIRAIGDPHERIKEDRLRMMRAVRLACRFHFAIDGLTEKAIRAHAKELFPAVAIERIWQELMKGWTFGAIVPMLLMLHDFGLLETIFPSLHGVAKGEIERRLEPVKDFPKEAPLISYLLELFPQINEQEAVKLCQFFKLSRKDVQFVEFLYHVKKCGEDVEWAHVYADPHSAVCLGILAAHSSHKQQFIEQHKERESRLHWAVERIRSNTPLITSEDLLNLGVLPGKQMGLLLKTAERLSVNENIRDKESVLKKLPSPKKGKFEERD